MTEFYIIEKNNLISRGRLEFWSAPDRMDNAIEVTERDHQRTPDDLSAREDYDPALPVLKRSDFDQYEKIQKDYAELMILRGRLIDAAVDFDSILDSYDNTGDEKNDIPTELRVVKAFADKKGF